MSVTKQISSQALQSLHGQRAGPIHVSGYASQLRAIGQAIEELEWRDFQIEVEGSNYLVRVEAARVPPKGAEAGRSIFGAFWRSLHDQQRSDARVSSGHVVLELRCNCADIEQSEREGRSDRQGSQRMPDLHSPSQVLRAAGGYLDGRGLRLLRIAKRGDRLSIEFETASRQRQVEEHQVSWFYDLGIRMYLRRSNR